MKQTPLIGIIGGTGKMGQWFQNFFASQKIPVIVASRTKKNSLVTVAKKADIIIVAVPISATEKTLEKIAPLVRSDALLTDITSLKVMPLEAMKKAKSAVLGMHPLFGPTIASTGLKIVFCRAIDNPYVQYLHTLFTKANIEVIEMSAEEHDYHMAYVQALTHAINLLFTKELLSEMNNFQTKLSTPLFSLQSLTAGRVLHQDLELTADIQLYNPYFAPMLTNIVLNAEKLTKILGDNDKKAFIALFAKEQKSAKEFSHYSLQQTNKILDLVSTVSINLPITTITVAAKQGTVGYLGPVGTFSHLAADSVFTKKSFKKIGYNSLLELFKAIESSVDFAIIPAENSIGGSIRETFDFLADFSFVVCGSFELSIHQQLLSLEKDTSSITTIVSHPQALEQCREWIKQNIPHAKLIEESSTTAALSNPKKKYGYIASVLAAKTYNLPIAAEDIENKTTNRTRFYVVSKTTQKISGLQTKKTLLFLSVYNRIGILRDILTVFANYDINLTKLESRPSKEKVWDYGFFVEVEEGQKGKLKNALKDLQTYCPVIRVLGKT